MTKYNGHRIKFDKYGMAENPIGLYVAWTIGARTFLAEVVGTFREECRGITMLKTRYFCGDEAPDVCASVVRILR